jgi:hypothetical protein
MQTLNTDVIENIQLQTDVGVTHNSQSGGQDLGACQHTETYMIQTH